MFQNEDYEDLCSALRQSATGLDIDVLFSRYVVKRGFLCSNMGLHLYILLVFCMCSFDGFEETAQYRLFTILGIPLYHSWVLNPEVCISLWSNGICHSA